MTFVHVGLAVAGFAAVAIPIIIHLFFRRRRRPVEWGAMRFLLEAYRKSRRRVRLEQWLLLALRCLLIALIGAALARPILQDIDWRLAQGGRHVYLLVDNGLASAAENADGVVALERHRAMAKSILAALGPSDHVALFALGEPVEALIDPPVVDHSSVGRMIEELRPLDSATNIPAALERLRESLEAGSDETGPVVVYLLSDLYAGSVDLNAALPDLPATRERTLALLAAPPRDEPISQTQVLAVAPDRPLVLIGSGGESEQVSIALRRVGAVGDAGVVAVRLEAGEGQAIANAVARFDPGESETTIDARLPLGSLPPGATTITASIDRDALAADNRRYAALDARRSLRVAVADRLEFGDGAGIASFSSGEWVRVALNPGGPSPIEVEVVDPLALDGPSLRRFDAVALTRPDLLNDAGWRSLREFVDGGGLLWLMPAEQTTAALWTDRAAEALDLPWRWSREAVEYLDENDPDSLGLALASEQPSSPLFSMLSGELDRLAAQVRVFRALPVVEGVDASAVALRLEDDTPFLLHTAPDDARGAVVYLASAPTLQWTSLPAKPIMVALAQEVVRQGLGVARRDEIIVGSRPLLQLPVSAVTLVGPGGSIALETVENGLRPTEAITTAGVYRAIDGAGRRVATLVANVNPSAGRTETVGPSEALQWLLASGDWRYFEPDEPAAVLAQATRQAEVSLWLLAIAVLIGVAETALARWFSHAYRTGVAGASDDRGLESTADTAGRRAAPDAEGGTTA
ncbi:MAG: BatA domain-containing protein [Phycisphaerales bacterium]